MKASVQDIKIGALFRFAASHRLTKPVVTELLQKRCDLKGAAAETLAGHWFTTEPFRNA